jgi:hypothetical protein
MTPVLALSLRPAGKAGLTEYVVTVPVTVGDKDEIAFPTTKAGAVG